MTTPTASNIRRTARAGAILGLASLALVACGRDAGSDAPVEQGEAIGDGKATGTIEVWAMGTEGEVLGDFAEAFAEENPDAEGRGDRRPVGQRPRQDRQRDRRR